MPLHQSLYYHMTFWISFFFFFYYLLFLNGKELQKHFNQHFLMQFLSMGTQKNGIKNYHVACNTQSFKRKKGDN